MAGWDSIAVLITRIVVACIAPKAPAVSKPTILILGPQAKGKIDPESFRS
jgi:hypothetical protein